MSTPSNAVPESSAGAAAVAPAAVAATRPLYWSVRREVWESRSIYVAPLAAAALVLFASCVRAAVTLPKRMATLSTLDPAKQEAALANPFGMAAAAILFTTFVVAAFYCLDALYGERRDRSILFWKSLPVSDRTTVLSKASIPLLVLPLVGFVIALATQIVLLLFSSLVLLANGLAPSELWVRVPLHRLTPVMLYGLFAHALWFAPLYAWMLLVSGWARRLPVLWAVLPPLAAGAVEKLAFNTELVCSLLKYRFIGAMTEAFELVPGHPARPLNFISTPGLWVGLVVAAAFLALAVRLRRSRDPV